MLFIDETSCGPFISRRSNDIPPRSTVREDPEAAASCSEVPLPATSSDGPEDYEVTAGLNWYLFRALRWTGNYVWARRASFRDISGWEMRFQLEF